MSQKSPGWELRLALVLALTKQEDTTDGEQLAALSAAVDDDAGTLFAVMLAYQQMLNRESRAKRKLAREDERLALEAKEAGIEASISKIELAKVEAAKRAAIAMAAAAWELVAVDVDVSEFALGMLDRTRPTSAVVPNVIGMSEPFANLTLLRAGLQIGISGSLAVGAKVAGQEPAAGRVVAYESVVIVDLAEK